MSGRRIDDQPVRLHTMVVHCLGCASWNNQVLLLCKALLYPLLHISATVIVRKRFVYTPCLEVVPAENLLAPKFESVKKMQVTAVRKSKLVFTERDPSFNWRRIIVNGRVSNQCVDPLHFHGDRLANRDLAAHYGVPKHSIVFRRCRI